MVYKKSVWDHGNILPYVVKVFRYTDRMEKYPYLNEAVAEVLKTRRAALGMSKRKLSELAMIERAYITGLENGKWNVTLNVLFYLSEALELDPVEFVRLVKEETRKSSLGR